MASTYVNNLRLNEMATGDASGTWGTTTNTNLELVGQALGYGTEAITTNADTHASTVADGAADEARAMYIKYTGTLDSACTITIGPNTLKRVHIIENATSGSQNIIIKQGSGATVTIGNGNVSVVYLDGAGSGAAVVNAFTDLETAGTITVAGNLIASADATVGDDLSLVSDAAVLGFGADTDVTLTHVADTGLLLNSSRQLQFGDSGTYIHQSADGTLDLVADTEIEINATTIDMNGALNLSGNALVSGEVQTANIGYTDGDNAIVIADGGGITAANGITSTAASNTFGATSFNDADITNVGSIALDTITNDGTDITLDSSGDIILDADGADIIFKDGGTSFGKVQNSSTNMIIESLVSDKDIQFYGNDGGASVLALTLDMSDAGTAIFNHDIVMGDNANIFMGNGYDLRLQSDGTNGIIYAANGSLTLDVAGNIILDADGGEFQFHDGGTNILEIANSSSDVIIRPAVQDKDLKFNGNDGGAAITALILDMSAAGAATFNSTIATGSGGASGKIAIAGNTATSEATHITFTNGAGAKVFAVGGGQSGVTNNGFVIRNVTDNTFPLVISDASAATFAAGVVVTGNTQSASLTVGTANDEGEALNIRDGGHTGHGAANTVSLASFAENVSGNSAGVWLGSMTNENTAVIGTRTATGNLGFQTYNGSAWGERMRIDNIGRVTKPAQPAFYATPSSAQSNIAANDSAITVAMGTEIYDVGGNFASSAFTAPVTGKYQLNLSLYLTDVDTAASYVLVGIVTSNRNYINIVAPKYESDPAYLVLNISTLADMDANDTAHVFYQQSGGASQTDVQNDTRGSYFQGFLAC